MQYAVDGVFHLYFGDAGRHPIIGNYLRSMHDLPQEVVLKSVPRSRVRRLVHMLREVVRARHRNTWALQCHDLASAGMGVFLWKGPVIYDAHEIYSSYWKLPLVKAAVHRLEQFVIRRANTTVFPSAYRSEYYDVGDSRIKIVENLYFPYEFGDDPTMSASAADATLSADGHPLTFLYTGLFSPARAIGDIVEAFRRPELAKCRLILAGKSNAYLDALLADCPGNVEYVGELGHAEVPRLLESADVSFALYQPINENNRRCAPTKIFECIYFGLQVIANRSPYIDELCKRNGGAYITALEEISPDEIARTCAGLKPARRPPEQTVRDSVSWVSQLPVIRSLYS